MKLVLAPRGGGKTTELIKMSHERGGYIVCTNHREAYRIAKEAEAMGLNIHFPITVLIMSHKYLWTRDILFIKLSVWEMLIKKF